MRSIVSSLAGLLWFKAALFALLAWNTAVYIHSGSLSDALDATAWLVLLILFELETAFADRMNGEIAATAVRAARIAAAAAVCLATAGYVRENEWLDAVNSGLWIAIVAVLEFQIRYGPAAVRYRPWLAAGLVALYAGLGALILMWLWRGEWFDAYDALLWLTALVVIELNILRANVGS